MALNNAPASGSVPPPRYQAGIAGWIRENLFASLFNGVLTVITGAVLVVAAWFCLGWVFLTADWSVIATIGGGFFIGQYNTELACPGQNCFWRPQAGLLLVTLLLGMAWGIVGRVGMQVALAVGIVSAALAFLPYDFESMGPDVRILLIANLPVVFAGWALVRYTSLVTVQRLVISGVVVFLLILVLLRGLPGVPGMQPVSVVSWGGLTLNLLLAVAGIVLSLPIGIALALGRRSNLPDRKAAVRGFHRDFPWSATDYAALHVTGACAAGVS